MPGTETFPVPDACDSRDRPAGPAACAVAVPSQPAAESPRTAATLPHMSAGPLTGAPAWLPPPTEPSPLVEPEPAGAPSADAPPRQPASARPSTAAAFPHTFAGSSAGACA